MVHPDSLHLLTSARVKKFLVQRGVYHDPSERTVAVLFGDTLDCFLDGLESMQFVSVLADELILLHETRQHYIVTTTLREMLTTASHIQERSLADSRLLGQKFREFQSTITGNPLSS